MNYLASEIKEKTWDATRKDRVNEIKHRFAMQEIRLNWPEVIRRDNSKKDKYWYDKQPWPYLWYNWARWFHVDNDVRDYAQSLIKK
jgi:hypothetical protein